MAKKHTTEFDDIENGVEESVDETPIDIKKKIQQGKDEEDGAIDESLVVIAYESEEGDSEEGDSEEGDSEEGDSEETYDPKNWKGSHPAEVAARHQSKQPRDQIGGSDEQILKDLRKLVFSVPLLPQKEVRRRFIQSDESLFPLVYRILDVSDAYLEAVMQIFIKVAAGNTYNKNIYEKEDSSNDSQNGTFKDHEMVFLKNSYQLYRLFITNEFKKPVRYRRDLDNITQAMEKCLFIRGVYEDVITDFAEKTKYYEDLHWMAIEHKLKHNMHEYQSTIAAITQIDKDLAIVQPLYSLSRDAKPIFEKYQKERSFIIAPYLRTVYSAARKTARNSHQMLDNFQNGSMGLLKAVGCYSTRRSASFASVAKSWIKQQLLLSIKEDANFVKLPVSTWQAYTQLEKAKAKAGLDDDEIDKIASAAKMSTKKAKSIYDTIKIAQVYSLNKTYDAEEKLTLEDIMTNEDKIGHDEDEGVILLKEYCDRAGLSEEERVVLALRHGMPDLIPADLPNKRASMKEALIQNLANLGYNFKFVI